MCVPDCAGATCGDDGCGGSCGECADGPAACIDGTCFEDAEGFPAGHCSAPCDLYCPDQDGAVTTFCVDGAKRSANSPSPLRTASG